MAKVLTIRIGAGIAIFFFLPIAAAFGLFVEGTIKWSHPVLLTIIPDFIWILFRDNWRSITSRELPSLLGEVSPNLANVGKGASF